MSATIDLFGNGDAFFNGEVLFRCEGNVTSRSVMPLVNLGQTILRRGEAIAPLQSMEQDYKRLEAELAALRSRIDSGYEAVHEMDAKIDAEVQGFIPNLAPANGERDDAAFVREMAKASVWPHVCVGEIKISLASVENGADLQQWLQSTEEPKRGGRKGKKGATAPARNTTPPVDMNFDLSANIVSPAKDDESNEAVAEGAKETSESAPAPEAKLEEAVEVLATVPEVEVANVPDDGGQEATATEETGSAVSEDGEASEDVPETASEEAPTDEQEPADAEVHVDPDEQQAKQPVPENAPDPAPEPTPVPAAETTEAPASDDVPGPEEILNMILKPGSASSSVKEEGPVESGEDETVAGEPNVQEDDHAAPSDNQPAAEPVEEEGQAHDDTQQASDKAIIPEGEHRTGLRPELQELSDQLEDDPEEDAIMVTGDMDFDEDGSPIMEGEGAFPMEDGEDIDDDEPSHVPGDGEDDADGTLSPDDKFWDDQFGGPSKEASKPQSEPQHGQNSEQEPGLDGDWIPEDGIAPAPENAHLPVEAEEEKAEPEPPKAPKAVQPPTARPSSRSQLPPARGAIPPRRAIISRGSKR